MKETNEWYQIELDTTKYPPVCAFTFHVPGGMSRSHSTETYVEYVPDPADPENTIYYVWLTSHRNNLRLFKYEDTIQWPAHDKLIVTKILEKINNSIVFLKHLDVFTSEDWPEVFGKTYKGYKTTRRKSENP